MEKFDKNKFGFVTDEYSRYFDDKRGEYRNLKSYDTWRSMITRCYNVNYMTYKNYGGKGVTICSAWKKYSNFKRWFDENYTEEGLQIDKDILCQKLGVNPKVYSSKTCMMITKSENTRESGRRLMKDVNLYFKGWEYYENNPIRRHSFKNVCKNNSEKFENFHEDWRGEKESYNTKMFVYTKIKNGEVRRFFKYVIDKEERKKKEYYEKNPILRGLFIQKCEKMNWDFLNFHEDWDGSSKKGSAKLFTYTQIKSGEERRFVENYYARKVNFEYFIKNCTQFGSFQRKCVNENVDKNNFIKQQCENSCTKKQKYYFIGLDVIKNEIEIANRNGVYINWI